jgi:modification methylase
MLKPGDRAVDAKRRWHRRRCRPTARLLHNGEAGFHPRMGAKVQGLDACNGWTFWHVETSDGLTVIDEFRSIIRKEMARAG